jgi:hypothetical protein
MLRSFCVGALVGFFFGSTKKGQDLREGIDGFLTDLTSGDAMKVLDEKKDELTEFASSTLSRFSPNKSNEEESSKQPQKQPQSGEQNFAPHATASESEASDTAKVLDADKAQELADKLGAKPSAPEDENLAAFSHSDDELKSA